MESVTTLSIDQEDITGEPCRHEIIRTMIGVFDEGDPVPGVEDTIITTVKGYS